MSLAMPIFALLLLLKALHLISISWWWVVTPLVFALVIHGVIFLLGVYTVYKIGSIE